MTAAQSLLNLTARKATSAKLCVCAGAGSVPFLFLNQMARRKRGFHLILGIVVGLLIGVLVRHSFVSRCIRRRYLVDSSSAVSALEVIKMSPEENTNNSKSALVFVGVMTAQTYLNDRAAAVWNTWAKKIPGRIAFFSSSGSVSPPGAPDLPLVALPGVDDRYPPQKKSFEMLRYMHDHLLERFEFFVRADDDVYIRMDKLEELLRSVDSRKPQFIGQAGRGNDQEFGLLSLEYDENFCMGGPGVILSRETLRRVGPHISACLGNLYSGHEDVELGRCVQRYAKIPCTWSYEMRSILHHNSSGARAFSGPLKTHEVHRAISLHPVKRPQLMYRLHAYVTGLQIKAQQQLSTDLHRDVAFAVNELREASSRDISPGEMELSPGVKLFPKSRGMRGYLGDTDVLGVKPDLNRFRPRTVEEVLPWEFVSRALYSTGHANPKRRMEAGAREGLDDVIREVMETINTFSRQRGRVIEFRELLYGYRRADPLHGHDLLLDLLLVYKKYRGKKMTVPVRRHAYVQQAFTGLEIREVPSSKHEQDPAYNSLDIPMGGPYDNDHTYSQHDAQQPIINLPLREIIETGLMKLSEKLNIYSEKREENINFILPLSGRHNTFKRFMENYEEVCLKSEEKCSLFVALYVDTSDYDKSVGVVEVLRNKYASARIVLSPVTDREFARAHALETALKLCSAESLLFFVDVDITFNARALRNIRSNTIKNTQAYYPIVYSEYDPEIVTGDEYNLKNSAISDHFTIDNARGYFRQFGFGITSIYKEDLIRAGGLNVEIKGWGLEDVKLFDKIVQQTNLTIFRTCEPNLVHVYHSVSCDGIADAAQYRMCLGTRVNTLGSYEHFENYVRNHADVIDFYNIANANDGR